MAEKPEKTEAECENVIKEFAEITATDEALAHFYLQDCDFDLDKALTAYFSDMADVEGPSNEANGLDDDEVQVLDEVPSKKMKRDCTNVTEGDIPKELALVSWNIDGNDKDALQTRFLAVLNVIAKLNPEIIFFQEFVAELLPKLHEVMSKMYTIIEPNNNFPYFVVTLVSKDIQIEHSENIPFGNTGMGRGMLIVEAKARDLKLKLINTHLESMHQHSGARQRQFVECMQKMRQFLADDNKNMVIFGGDLNIRDNEISSMPINVQDAWVAGGRDHKHQFTWDQTKNDNHTAWKKRQHRFDRIYFKGPYEKVDFSLHGTQRIRQTMVFPSDHWAIFCRFMRPVVKL